MEQTQAQPATDRSGEGEVDQSKLEFLDRLKPLVIKENRRLQALRTEVTKLIQRLDKGETLPKKARRRLLSLAKQYRVDGNPIEQEEAQVDLLDRIDIIPLSLALAQAATESAWGQSRFAREGNNLFGIWTYDESQGLVPKQRAKGKTHLVRKFETLDDSLRYYMHTLNSHPAYAELRRIRSEKRRAGIEPQGTELAEGLEKYSAKGKKYIELIQRVIQQNDLALLDGVNSQA